MSTVLSTLYPPLIDTFMPAFVYTGPAVVNFTISPYNSYNSIKYLHITLVNQKTNQNVLKTTDDEDTPLNTKLVNGIWVVPFTNNDNFLVFNSTDNFYSLQIPASILKNSPFICQNYYKLQIRFDCCIDIENVGEIEDSSYFSQKRAYFSEWSSICLLKAVPTIKLHLKNFTLESQKDYVLEGISVTDNSNNTQTRVPKYVPGIIPVAGNLSFQTDSQETTSNNEYLSYYYITILDHITKEVYIESGKQFPNEINNFYYLFDMTSAITNTDYDLTIKCVTNNQYEFEQTFQFTLIEPSNIEFEPNWDFNKIELSEYSESEKVLVTSEDGLIYISINVPQLVSPGYLFIKRANSLDKFKKWELIDCHYVADGDNFTHSIVDRTVGSLVTYKYSCQYLTAKESWTKTKYSPEIIYPDFHDILISRGDKQLAIRYNAQIASLTPTVSRVKIETLGGRYPKFAENAKVNYKQLQLTGLITAESDYNRKFLSDLDFADEMDIYDDRIGGQYLIRNDTVKEPFWDSDYTITDDGYGTYTADIIESDTKIQKHKRDTQGTKYGTKHDIYPMNNWWWERKFREEVIKWLNDGEPKLYRSMTEGNMIVIFDNISLTPNVQLGRRIWNISATVYEVGDGYSLDALSSLGIYPVSNEWAASLNSDEDNETPGATRRYLGQLYEVMAVNNTNKTGVIFKDNDNDNIISLNIYNNRNELMDTKIQTIYENLGSLYSGLYSKYHISKTSSIVLNNLKIQFTSKPQWYKFDQYKNIVLLPNNENLTDENELDTQGKNCYLGYKLGLKFKNQDVIIDFFINEKGYYQVPSNMSVNNVYLYDGAIATFDYILSYDLKYDDPSEPNAYEIAEKIVGQVAGEWISGKNIANVVKTKYEAKDYNATGGLTTRQMVDNWTAVDFDLEPYTIINLSTLETSKTTEYIIGRSGVLTLQTDFPTDDCIISGRRMIVVDESRQPYLDEWECVLDTSVFQALDSDDDVAIDGTYWWILTESEDEQYISSPGILVSINLNNFDFSEDSFRTIISDWRTLSESTFFSKYDIEIPQMNRVYAIINENGFYEYKIYYLDKGWFNVVFPFAQNNNYDIVYARVPIHGMINYRADIMKKLYVQESMASEGMI